MRVAVVVQISPEDGLGALKRIRRSVPAVDSTTQVSRCSDSVETRLFSNGAIVRPRDRSQDVAASRNWELVRLTSFQTDL